ncbi:MAG: glutathione S-transferase family protein [Pseudomonadales bacterium]|jgi:glutathione S-transferase|nr:glutathione S-transferase family protein [Pseudomonadales bacterium]
MPPVITVFADAPDRGRGLARDLPVRWAFEELGQPYEVRLVHLEDMRQPRHRALHPFGQIPVLEDGELVLFESGAIVLHLAQRYDGLLPQAPIARARAIMWMFTALNTIEPVVLQREVAGHEESGEPWHEARAPYLEGGIRRRLVDLARHLGTRDWLEGTFSAGDLLMVQVLRRLSDSELLAEQPRLEAYVRRAEARPAFRRAFAAQRETFLRSRRDPARGQPAPDADGTERPSR